jgi:predicted nicotinamide N-methyase
MSEFFAENGYKKVGLCCFGTLGTIFAEEMAVENSETNDITIEFIADKRADIMPANYNNIPIILPEKITEQSFDVIVVSHVYYYNEIADYLIKLGVKEEQIISLNDIVFSL